MFEKYILPQSCTLLLLVNIIAKLFVMALKCMIAMIKISKKRDTSGFPCVFPLCVNLISALHSYNDVNTYEKTLTTCVKYMAGA
jgi:hypothetical protein